MEDEDLIREFVKVESRPDSTVISVCAISWPSPGEPHSTWVEARRLSVAATASEVQSALARLLADRKYFRRCRYCGERTPLGCMHDRDVCQGCATKHFGVIY